MEECHFGKMKLWRVEHFWTYLSSHLGVIAEYNNNHAQKWRQTCPKVFNQSEFHFSEVTFFQNWYFSISNLFFNSSYAICVRRQAGHCCIEYSLCSDASSWTLDNLDATKAKQDDLCTSDWVGIDGKCRDIQIECSK